MRSNLKDFIWCINTFSCIASVHNQVRFRHNYINIIQMSNDDVPSHMVYKYLYDQTYGYFKVKQDWVPFAIPPDPQFNKVEISESFQFYFVNNTGLVHQAIGKIVFKRNGGFHDIVIKKWK